MNKHRSEYTFKTTKHAFQAGVPNSEYVEWLEHQLDGAETINTVLGTLLTITWALLILYFLL